MSSDTALRREVGNVGYCDGGRTGKCGVPEAPQVGKERYWAVPGRDRDGCAPCLGAGAGRPSGGVGVAHVGKTRYRATAEGGEEGYRGEGCGRKGEARVPAATLGGRGRAHQGGRPPIGERGGRGTRGGSSTRRVQKLQGDPGENSQPDRGDGERSAAPQPTACFVERPPAGGRSRVAQDLGRQQAQDERDPQRNQHHIVEEAENGDGVGDQVDGAESVGEHHHGGGPGCKRGPGIAIGDGESRELPEQCGRPAAKALDGRHGASVRLRRRAQP